MLVLGVLLAILAMFTPGTGLLELGALLILILAGWEIYNLPINLWALLLLVLGMFPFLLAVRQSQKTVFLGAAIVSFVLGSSFLFRGDQWWQPAVNPILALVISLLTGTYLWIAINKVLEITGKLPSHNLGAIIGATGEAKSEIYNEGSVQVASELWTARSEALIPAGSKVRVVAQEGLILVVEKVP
jgi:membrane-bound serine protease (ClpP class)